MPSVSLANGRRFDAAPGTSILDAAAAAGVVLEHSCRTGRCGSCKVRVTTGATTALRDETSLSYEEAANGWILTCTRAAETDLALDAEDLSALAGIAVKTLPSRIHAITPVADDVVRIELRLPPKADFAFVAGQYLDLTGPGGSKRSYSIASPMHRPELLELQVRRVAQGAMSDYWFTTAKAGDLLRFRGPLGTFFLRDVAGLDLVFLATGTGFAPVQSMLAQLEWPDAADRPASVQVIWGGRTPQDLYLALPTSAEGVRYTPVLSRADASWPGARGHVQDVLLAQRPDLARTAVYACGSDAMIHSARAVLVAAGLAPGRFHADAFVASN